MNESEVEQPAERRGKWRTLGRWAFEALLVVIIIGLVTATLMPAIVTHWDGQKGRQSDGGK